MRKSVIRFKFFDRSSRRECICCSILCRSFSVLSPHVARALALFQRHATLRKLETCVLLFIERRESRKSLCNGEPRDLRCEAAVGTMANQVAGARSEDQGEINELNFRLQAFETNIQNFEAQVRKQLERIRLVEVPDVTIC